jgi:outer membrane protein OmpA-like peptidoglycan-associated protein
MARALLAVLALLAFTAAAATLPPYATLPRLPLANDLVEYESYGQAEFVLKEKTDVYRGKYWAAGLVWEGKYLDERAAHAAIIDALQKGGWQVVTRDDPANPPSATLRYTKDGKDAWLRLETFEHAIVKIVERGMPATKLSLEPPKPGMTKVAENADFPFLKRFPGSKLGATRVQDDAPMVVEVAEDKEPVMVSKGTVIKSYQTPPGTGRLEVIVAYREALKFAGWEIVREMSGIGLSDPNLTAHYAKGDVDLWVWIHAPGEEISVTVGDAGAERAPNRLKAELDKACKVAIYGVHFDFDKSTLRPDAEPALNSLLKLLTDHPDLAVELGGHTDNVGKRDYNLKLSEARVNTVRGWLVGKGVKAERLTAKGYADTQPVAANDATEGRAKNRRVELRKARCP